MREQVNIYQVNICFPNDKKYVFIKMYLREAIVLYNLTLSFAYHQEALNNKNINKRTLRKKGSSISTKKGTYV